MRFLFIFIILYYFGFSLFGQGKDADIASEKRDTVQVTSFNLLSEKFINSSPDTAFVYAKKALELAEKLNFKKGIARSCENLGWVFYQQGIFKQSIEYFLKAISFYQTIGDKRGIAENYNHLGMAYYYGLEIDISMKSHFQALEIYKVYPDERGKAETFGYLGTIYEKKHDYKQALFYQNNALELYERLKDKTGEGRINENLGSIYEDLEDYEKAFQYFNKALLLNQQTNNQVNVINNLNNIGDVYRKQGKSRASIIFTLKACELAKKLHQTYMLRSAFKDLSKAYVLLNDFKIAHAYLDSSYSLYQIIYDDESARQIARMQAVYETEEKERELSLKNAEIQLLEQEKSISRLSIILLVGGTILIVAFGIVFLKLQKVKAHKEAELAEHRQKLMSTELENAHLNEQKLKTELENKELKELQLQQELELRAKELTSHALQIVQKNKFLEELKVSLNVIRKSEKDKGKQIKDLINSIDYNFKSDRDWDDFKRFFEQVHQDFFQKLQANYPDINSNDLRLCALLKLNLSSADIATILGISQDSLRISRYRLRKKLKLEEGKKLNTFLISL